MTLAELLRDPHRSPVFFEVIPPRRRAPPTEISDAASRLRDLLGTRPVDAINVPEVRNETRSGAAMEKFVPRLDPREYGSAIQRAFGREARLVVNHPTVYEPAEQLDVWLRSTLATYLVHGLVLVGGESSARSYPGPDPLTAARQLAPAARRAGLPIGGIVIPTRRREGPHDEPRRLVAKSQAGMSFFTCQVLCEADATQRLLRDYAAACAGAGVQPSPVLISVAPITSERDLGFLKWLGVTVPAGVEAFLRGGTSGMTPRSVELAARVVTQIGEYAQRLRPRVPLGLNVEHIMKHNVAAAVQVLDAVQGRLRAQA